MEKITLGAIVGQFQTTHWHARSPQTSHWDFFSGFVAAFLFHFLAFRLILWDLMPINQIGSHQIPKIGSYLDVSIIIAHIWVTQVCCHNDSKIHLPWSRCGSNMNSGVDHSNTQVSSPTCSIVKPMSLKNSQNHQKDRIGKDTHTLDLDLFLFRCFLSPSLGGLQLREPWI